MKKTSFIVLVLVCLVTLFACNRMKFNKENWSEESVVGFPSNYRQLMLHDLIDNHELIGLNYLELVDQLGKSDRITDSKVYSNIIVKYGEGIDNPRYTKDLVFNLSSDSVVKSFTVSEWETK